MATRTVTHPNGDLKREEALTQLYAHPQYPKNARVVDIEKTASGWEAKLEIQAGPFPPGSDDSEAPPKPASPDSESDAAPTPDDDSAPSEDGPPKDEKPGEDGEKPKKPSVEDQLLELGTLVHQIAEAVGVTPHGGEEGPPVGPDGPLGPHGGPPGAPHGAPPGGPPAGPAGPPAPHGGPGAGGRVQRPLRPGEAPPGTTPVGAPSFASLTPAETKLATEAASFVVSETTDASLADCKQQIEAKYNPAGFVVKRLVEAKDDEGKRLVRAKISRR